MRIFLQSSPVSSQFRQPLQLVIEVHGNFLSKGVPWQIENLKNRIGTKKNENHLFRGVGSLTRHSGHVWTLGAHSEQMMCESGHMKIGGLAVSRQMGHLRSSSFFSIASLRNSISALGAFILDMGLWGEVILLRIGFLRTISHFTCEPFCCWSHECGDPLERKKLLLGYCGCAHRRY